MEDLYPEENIVKKHNALLLNCTRLTDYTEDVFSQICKEKSEKDLGRYIHKNKYTIHEAYNPLTQSPPGLINGVYNHDGGVSETRNVSKNNSCRKKRA